jgi:hypothetical protein
MKDDQQEKVRSEKCLSGYQPFQREEEERGGMQPRVKGERTPAQLAQAGHADFNSPPVQSKPINENKETGA